MSCGKMSKRRERQAYRQRGAEGARELCGWKRETLKERRSEKDGGRESGERRTEEAYGCKVVSENIERMAGIRMPKRERSRNVTSDRLTETALARLKRAVALSGVESCRSEVIIAVQCACCADVENKPSIWSKEPQQPFGDLNLIENQQLVNTIG